MVDLGLKPGSLAPRSMLLTIRGLFLTALGTKELRMTTKTRGGNVAEQQANWLYGTSQSKTGWGRGTAFLMQQLRQFLIQLKNVILQLLTEGHRKIYFILRVKWL